jgi:MraZ protein
VRSGEKWGTLPECKCCGVNRFLGRYVHQLDAKGRVSLPAPFRRGLDDDTFILIQVHADALTLYPSQTWQRVEEKLVEMQQRRPETRHFVLGLVSKALDVTPDKQGRILIPEHLRTTAGLEGEALIVGALDKIEVWDPARFEENVEAGRPDEDLDQIIGSIFA